MYNKLQYISQGDDSLAQQKNIQTALEAGCKWIQLRFKDATASDLMATATFAKSLCAKYQATFIVNDNVAVAKAVDADGVHLGLTDTAIDEARLILGSEKIIGGTANTLEHLLQRQQEGCNYIGLGPLRFTTTKKKLSPILGFEGYHSLIAQAPGLTIPIYAIGGICEQDIAPLLATGVHGIAVSGLLTSNTQPATLINTLNELLYERVENC